MTTIVSIDIETTGLDENRDAIIEIGAVKFNGKRVEDEFSTLLNPGKPIPDFITGLTGIDNAMVRGAPRPRKCTRVPRRSLWRNSSARPLSSKAWLPRLTEKRSPSAY